MGKPLLVEGEIVHDRWYPEWGTGIVVEITGTHLHINFTLIGARTYDWSHAKHFLERGAFA